LSIKNFTEIKILSSCVVDVQSSDVKYSESCLRCLRTLVCRRSMVDGDVIFTVSINMFLAVNRISQHDFVDSFPDHFKGVVGARMRHSLTNTWSQTLYIINDNVDIFLC